MMRTDWTCVVLTSPSSLWIQALEDEVRLLQKKGCISKQTMLLTVEDPSEHIGSGASLLNALVVAAEYLSAKHGYTTIVGDVLQNASILVIPYGSHYLFDTCGKPFIALAREGNTHLNQLITTLENSLHVLSRTRGNSFGVWVCSTDVLLSVDLKSLHCQDTGKDAVLYSVEASVNYAKNHGCIVVGNNNVVEKILYCENEDVLMKYRNKRNMVSVVSGVVYLSPDVAETLLSLPSYTPLESCTYLGIDSGFEALPMSLFFDLIIAMASGISENDFILGKHCKAYNIKKDVRQEHFPGVLQARKVIWDRLHKFSLTVFQLTNTQHIYWDEKLTLNHHISNVFMSSQSNLKSTPLLHDSIIQNSIIDCNCKFAIGKDSLVCHSMFSPRKEPVQIGHGCYVSSVKCSSTETINIPDFVAVVGFQTTIENRDMNGVFVMGVHDSPFLPISDPRSGFCNVSWSDFLMRTGLSLVDIWDENIKEEDRNLWNARLFFTSSKLEDYMWFFGNSARSLSWTSNQKMSLLELMKLFDPRAELNWRREIKSLRICKHILDSISQNLNESFLKYFTTSFIEGWSEQVLGMLDLAAIKHCENSVILRRILSCTADFLGTMAGKFGLLRSGPGNNKLWSAAFNCLEKGDVSNALSILKDARTKWFHRSDLLVRASRHYERAVQILIKNAVMTSKQYIACISCNMPEIGQWIKAECPARVDLQGGWTDTPPICFEQGGSVVNMAVAVDGMKPLGAEACRINEKHIVFILGKEEFATRMEINEVSDLQDYSNPIAVGALLKAAIICAKIVDVTSSKSLQSQLAVFQSGFKICIWSNLPHGSGMGTSSILAGAAIAVLWAVSGQSYNRESLIHAALYLEQLMTTGGGWQDQIGGIMGGVNRGFSLPELPLHVHVQALKLENDFLALLNRHFLLIYTGKVRLAKNLLQNVIRNWYAKEDDVIRCFHDLKDSSLSLVDAINSCNLKSIGDHMNAYWNMKKVLAPGCEPAIVTKLMQVLEEYTFGQVLAGAGGGGFMCVLTKIPNAMETVKHVLQEQTIFSNITVHSLKIDTDGLMIS